MWIFVLKTFGIFFTFKNSHWMDFFGREMRPWARVFSNLFWLSMVDCFDLRCWRKWQGDVRLLSLEEKRKSSMFCGPSCYHWLKLDWWGRWSSERRGEKEEREREREREREGERRRVLELGILVYYSLSLFSNDIIDDFSVGKNNMSFIIDVIIDRKLNI